MSKIRQSAKGEECQVRIIGVCNGDPSTTVWAHANGLNSNKGLGKKSLDILGAYACSDCHDAIDGRKRVKFMTREEIEMDFHHGHQRSVVILDEKGLI